MLAHLERELDTIRQRGIVARGSVEKARLRNAYKATDEIKKAIERHVPADVAPAEQRGLRGID